MRADRGDRDGRHRAAGSGTAGSVRLALALGAVVRALERAAGLLEEDVVERGLVELEVGDADAVGVERSHDVGERLGPRREAHRDALGASGRGLAERGERGGQALLVVRVGRRRLERDPADLGLQCGRRALRDDLPVVDDPDAVGEHVGLLEVLRRQEDGDAVLTGEPLDLRPQRAAALRVQARRRLVEEEDARTVQQREREVQAPLHAAGVPADLAPRGVAQPDAVEQRLAARAALGLREPVQPALEVDVLPAGEEVVERGLLERRADRAADLRAVRRDVEARDEARPPDGGSSVTSISTVVDLPAPFGPRNP